MRLLNPTPLEKTDTFGVLWMVALLTLVGACGGQDGVEDSIPTHELGTVAPDASTFSPRSDGLAYPEVQQDLMVESGDDLIDGDAAQRSDVLSTDVMGDARFPHDSRETDVGADVPVSSCGACEKGSVCYARDGVCLPECAGLDHEALSAALAADYEVVYGICSPNKVSFGLGADELIFEVRATGAEPGFTHFELVMGSWLDLQSSGTVLDTLQVEGSLDSYELVPMPGIAVASEGQWVAWGFAAGTLESPQGTLRLSPRVAAATPITVMAPGLGGFATVQGDVLIVNAAGLGNASQGQGLYVLRLEQGTPVARHALSGLGSSSGFVATFGDTVLAGAYDEAWPSCEGRDASAGARVYRLSRDALLAVGAEGPVPTVDCTTPRLDLGTAVSFLSESELLTQSRWAGQWLRRQSWQRLELEDGGESIQLTESSIVDQTGWFSAGQGWLGSSRLLLAFTGGYLAVEQREP